MFSNDNGYPISKNTLRRNLFYYYELAKIKVSKIHESRHSWQTFRF